MGIAIVLLAGTFSLLSTYGLLFRRVVVHEYEAGLFYRRGRFKQRVGAGAYRLFKPWSEMSVIDLRQRIMQIQGQAVLSSDNVGLKVSVAATFQVSSPEKALHAVQDYAQALYTSIQIQLRNAIAASKIDDLLQQRLDVGNKLLSSTAPEAEAIGLKLHPVEIKDVMFPGELKKIFAEVVRAQKEGQAALERARGETAALRNLANAAKMIEDNPSLLNLRVLQSVSSGGPGNTFVLGLPHNVVMVDKKTSNATPATEK